MKKRDATTNSEWLKIRREIVMRHLHIDRWINSKVGEFTCPLGHPSAWVFLDGALTLHCPGGEERRCFEELRSIAAEIREELRETKGESGFVEWEPTEEDRRRSEEKIRYYQQVAFLARNVGPIAYRHRKTVDDLRAASPMPITAPVEDHWRSVLQHLFNPSDVVWIGELNETSQPEYAANFREVSDWLKRAPGRRAFGPHWSPACFKRRMYYRRKEDVYSQRLFPVEGDLPLSLNDQASLLLWLAKAYPLVSVTFSGRASLHALFFHPLGSGGLDWEQSLSFRRRTWERFTAVLEALGFDLSNFRYGGTSRCPGFFREPDKEGMTEGAWQRLLYLDPSRLQTKWDYKL